LSLRIALVGNPNCGKTTLFNELTGSSQFVGNWPGVTVEKKAGRLRKYGSGAEIVDLPGVYSLSPYTMEETVTRDYLIGERPEAVVNILDGTNPERNLYLTLQLMELGLPLVLAVNMMDEVKSRGDALDCRTLGELLGVPAVPIVARRGEGIPELVRTAEDLARGRLRNSVHLRYDDAAEHALSRILCVLADANLPKNYPLPFCASKLLEGDDSVAEAIGLGAEKKREIAVIRADSGRKSEPAGGETMMADARYRLIARIVEETFTRRRDPEAATLSDRIDRIATGRWTAIPLFLLVMLGTFAATFGGPGRALGRLVESGVSFLDLLLTLALNYAGAPAWVRSLFLDAVLGGVGGVLSFLPQVSLLFLFLSVLEDSGYMARAAFITDRLLRRIGLTGRSFIPMLMGFGCTTPAVMAAKGTGSERERRLTILLTPFLSCSARLPIYGLFAGIFFAKHQGFVIFSMYLAGMLTVALCGLLLKGTVCRGESSAFVMELPPYRLPSPPNLALHVWEKCRGFLVKAGTVIFAMSVAAWFLQNFGPPLRMAEDPAGSFFGIFGRWIAPVFAPLGFGNWQSSAALLTGLAAKETVVSTLYIVFGAEGIAAAFTPVSAFSFMLFSLLYMPCMSAFVTVKKELGSWRAACRNALFQTAVAWLVSFAFYQTASMIGRIFGEGSAGRDVALAGFVLAAFALIALALSILYKSLRNFIGGGRPEGCAGCPMQGRCEQEKRP